MSNRHNDCSDDDDNMNNGESDIECMGYGKCEMVNSKTINDILKYGAGNHSVDSNPGETQSEWSDEDDKDDEDGKGDLS